MTSVQDRLKLKRTTCDTWNTREQLCLASSVLKSGDQNWMSVSRSLKPLLEKDASRPPDWFSQKSCALQYAHLLENTDAPKRKKRESGETSGESIVRRLTQERIQELSQVLSQQREEYKQLKAEVSLIKSRLISDDKLQKMWHAIEQEEREYEQKARAHSAWLAKRQQQKQEMSSLQQTSVGSQHKMAETPGESQQQTEVVDEEEKKARGGRSPLLTSLLKSPSPTTQIQATTQPIQVSSPTITSLLGSSPKVPNPQLIQTVSPQLHQMVSPTITTTPSERPSAGAPTLSMLLEMPANAQRGPLPNLQTNNTTVPQQTIPTEVHTLQPQTTPIQNEIPMAPGGLPINASANVPVTEGMVQIDIDHLDDVIRKDIMADVMDKDEINEIIGDIEELIKEEITGSPQTVDTGATTINTIPVPQAQEIPVVPERPQPRDVDEAVSLSNSPQSEMAIEEIDSSTSNIAEIIGTVAIEPPEPKVIVAEITEPVSHIPEESKSETSTTDVTFAEERAPELESNEGESSKEAPQGKPVTVEHAIVESKPNVTADINETKTSVSKEAIEDTAKEQIVEQEETDIGEPLAKESRTEVKEQTESVDNAENKDNMELDQLELHLAKITGEQDVTSAEVVSVSSEVTNDLPSTEDAEKSQDISLILEDDESTQSLENKRKIISETVTENTAESAESMESFKEENVISSGDKSAASVKETLSVKSQEDQTETLEIFTDELKKEDTKDSSEDTTSSILQDIEVKEEEIEDTTISERSTTATSSQETEKTKKEPLDPVKTEIMAPTLKKEQDIPTLIKVEEPKVEEREGSKSRLDIKIPEELKKEVSMVKEDKSEKKMEDQGKREIESTISTGEETAELDEEESSLSKLSGGRAMKTYPSKKHNISVDSETETEATGEGADYRAWKKAVMLVYNRLATHKYASVFLRPITEDQAPGYHTVIFRPMDLSTIKKNIDNGTIRSTMHFQRDVMLMFQNAIMYNKHDTFIYKMAVSMQEECLQHMQILVQVTGEGTLRRETRTATSSSSDIGDIIKRKRSHITPSPHDTESPRSKKRRKSEND